MSRQKVPIYEAKAVRKRLKDFAKTRFGSWAGFLRRVAPPRTTAEAWSNAGRPSVPDAYWLLRIAEKTNISLNWLLLGEGPELRVRIEATPAEQLRAAVEAELRQSEELSAEEFEAVWDRMFLRGDLQHAEEVVLALAVDGVRARFQENIRLMRHYQGIAHLYNAFVELLNRDRSGSVDMREAAIRRFAELVEAPLDHNFEQLSKLIRRQKAETHAESMASVLPVPLADSPK